VSFRDDLVSVTPQTVNDAVRWVQSLNPRTSSVSQMSLCQTINAALKLACVCCLTEMILVSVIVMITLEVKVLPSGVNHEGQGDESQSIGNWG